MNREHLESRIEDSESECERLREEVQVLRSELHDALQLVQDYKDTLARLNGQYMLLKRKGELPMANPNSTV